MQDSEKPSPATSGRTPWNKGKLTGAKPPLRPKHVWSIRTKLQMADRKRDLALFNLAIDSKLRGCDVVTLKVEDIAPHGYAIERATVRQKKTDRPVRFEVTEPGKQLVTTCVWRTGSKDNSFLPHNVGPSGARRGRRQIDHPLHGGRWHTADRAEWLETASPVIRRKITGGARIVALDGRPSAAAVDIVL